MYVCNTHYNPSPARQGEKKTLNASLKIRLPITSYFRFNTDKSRWNKIKKKRYYLMEILNLTTNRTGVCHRRLLYAVDFRVGISAVLNIVFIKIVPNKNKQPNIDTN